MKAMRKVICGESGPRRYLFQVVTEETGDMDVSRDFVIVAPPHPPLLELCQHLRHLFLTDFVAENRSYT